MDISLLDVSKVLEAKNQAKRDDKALESILLEIIGKKDVDTLGHCERVSYYCSLMGEYLNFSKEEVEVLSVGAALHDIGKVAIPDRILKKPASLTEEEREIMQNHTCLGIKLIQVTGHFKELYPLILYHHERYDGTGYPYGLDGKQIPLFARIISVADSYDAMTSNRTYRKPMNQNRAMQNLISGKGTQFDPNIVDAFIMMMRYQYISKISYKAKNF